MKAPGQILMASLAMTPEGVNAALRAIYAAQNNEQRQAGRFPSLLKVFLRTIEPLTVFLP
jgi:hypothetical protein